MNDNCLFCKIAAGAIPSAKVYEDDKVLAFLDIAPFNPGHTIIVPKTHCVSSTELDPQFLAAIAVVAPRIGAALVRAAKAEGFNLLLNNGRVAGQVVPHVHAHVIPRRADDQIVISAPGGKYDSPEAMQELAEAIRRVLER